MVNIASYQLSLGPSPTVTPVFPFVIFDQSAGQAHTKKVSISLTLFEATIMILT
jgi:hypothetical protein